MRSAQSCGDRRGRIHPAALVLAIGISLAPTLVSAAPITMRYPEGPARGFLVLSDLAGSTLAHGELIQWLERQVIASRLVIRFDDGSLYDEIVRFSQNRVFRVLSYHLVQKGPAFTEPMEVQFDRSGRYRVRLRPAPDEEEQQAAGTIKIPEDVSNGMTSTLLKNLKRGASATTHLLAFTPKPRVLELHLTPEGTDQFWIGRNPERATRYLIKPEVTGITGVLASVVGKQPPSFHMWIAEGKAPVLVKFEGPLYADGPIWRIELASLRWKP